MVPKAAAVIAIIIHYLLSFPFLIGCKCRKIKRRMDSCSNSFIFMGCNCIPLLSSHWFILGTFLGTAKEIHKMYNNSFLFLEIFPFLGCGKHSISNDRKPLLEQALTHKEISVSRHFPSSFLFQLLSQTLDSRSHASSTGKCLSLNSFQNGINLS